MANDTSSTAGASRPSARRNTVRRCSTRRRGASGADFTVLAEHSPESIGNFAERGAGVDGGDDGWHEIRAIPRRALHSVQCAPPGRRIAALTHLSHALRLTPFALGIDLQERDRGGLLGHILVDPNDDGLA